jgi:hypothetical protein
MNILAFDCSTEYLFAAVPYVQRSFSFGKKNRLSTHHYPLAHYPAAARELRAQSQRFKRPLRHPGSREFYRPADRTLYRQGPPKRLKHSSLRPR